MNDTPKILILILLLGPSLITWLLQPLLKFHKEYSWVVLCFTCAIGAYVGRENYYYWGLKIEPGQMIGVSTCFLALGIWQFVLIRKNKNKPKH
jgi:hypothetical protein